jgi:hypothetical protein
MLSSARIGVGPYDLATLIDPIGLSGSCAGPIDWREDAGGIEKAMHFSMRIIVDPHDLAACVDAIGHGGSGAGEGDINRTEGIRGGLGRKGY